MLFVTISSPSQDSCGLCQKLGRQEVGEQGQEAGAEQEVGHLPGVVMEAEPVAGQTGNTDTLQQPGAGTRHSPEPGAHIFTSFT